MADKLEYPPLWRSVFRLAMVFLLVFLISAAVHQLMSWFTSVGRSPALMGGLLVLMLLVYAIFIAVPFVPGVEIGISLIVLRGYQIVPFVYLATVAGLAIAFLIGRFVSYRWLHQLALDLRLKRACRWLDHVHSMSPAERVAALEQGLGQRLGAYFVRYRLIALAILFNIPGNTLIGGGGGIAMLAGLSRIYSTPATILTIALAVSPVPLAAWMFGIDILGTR